jgi:hypothetical protein
MARNSQVSGYEARRQGHLRKEDVIAQHTPNEEKKDCATHVVNVGNVGFKA